MKKRPTREEVFDARTSKGGWTRAQLEQWGVPWPPPRGWIGDLCGPEARDPAPPKSIPADLPLEERAKQSINYAHREMMIGSMKRARKFIRSAEKLAAEAGLSADYLGAIRGLKARIERKIAEGARW